MRITTALIFAWRKSRGGIGEDADQGGAINLLVRDGGREKDKMDALCCMYACKNRRERRKPRLFHQPSNK